MQGLILATCVVLGIATALTWLHINDYKAWDRGKTISEGTAPPPGQQPAEDTATAPVETPVDTGLMGTEGVLEEAAP